MTITALNVAHIRILEEYAHRNVNAMKVSVIQLTAVCSV